jgi:pyrimidine operon attenuation protein/uracil phosphoribosyltransferase
VRAALDAIHSFGRPENIELMVLIDRRFSRDLPIQPNYTGAQVDAIASERVVVEWKEIAGGDIITLTNDAEE